VGLIEFNSSVTPLVRLGRLRDNCRDILSAIDRLQPRGETALLDAVKVAYYELQERASEDRINARVVLTDGLENRSQTSADELADAMREGNECATPVVVYCIAYGQDAAYDELVRIATPSRGKAYRADEVTIADVYEVLARLF
jgi:Ca-activated chloride channel family protein